MKVIEKAAQALADRHFGNSEAYIGDVIAVLKAIRSRLRRDRR